MVGDRERVDFPHVNNWAVGTVFLTHREAISMESGALE